MAEGGRAAAPIALPLYLPLLKNISTLLYKQVHYWKCYCSTHDKSHWDTNHGVAIRTVSFVAILTGTLSRLNLEQAQSVADHKVEYHHWAWMQEFEGQRLTQQWLQLPHHDNGLGQLLSWSLPLQNTLGTSAFRKEDVYIGCPNLLTIQMYDPKSKPEHVCATVLVSSNIMQGAAPWMRWVACHGCWSSLKALTTVSFMGSSHSWISNSVITPVSESIWLTTFCWG